MVAQVPAWTRTVLMTIVTALASGPALARPATVVAIDPGHGGTNLGAPGLGPGVFEKTVTLALARRVRELLSSDGGDDDNETTPGASGISVVLCRDADILIPIRARARCAAESGARLFLSLHANAVPAGSAPGSRHGFEVFVLGPGEVDDDAAVASLSAANPADAAWAAHEIRAAAEQSVNLARVVAAHLGQVVEPAVRNGIRQSGASLDVLRGAGTPAVLVEVGFMDHPEEGGRLGNPAGRERLAEALAAAIRDYLRAAEPVPTATARTDSRALAASNTQGTREPPKAQTKAQNR